MLQIAQENQDIHQVENIPKMLFQFSVLRPNIKKNGSRMPISFKKTWEEPCNLRACKNHQACWDTPPLTHPPPVSSPVCVFSQLRVSVFCRTNSFFFFHIANYVLSLICVVHRCFIKS